MTKHQHPKPQPQNLNPPNHKHKNQWHFKFHTLAFCPWYYDWIPITTHLHDAQMGKAASDNHRIPLYTAW